MSNKLISSILDLVYGHYYYIECALREHTNHTVTSADNLLKLQTPSADHPRVNMPQMRAPKLHCEACIAYAVRLAQHHHFELGVLIVIPTLKQTH